jgi:hypothetical protein
MILYIVTISIEPNVAHEWLAYMREKHIPQVLATGCFFSHEIFRVVDPPHERDWPTYAIHYRARSRGDYDRYIAQHAADLRKDVIDRYGKRFTAARILVELVE